MKHRPPGALIAEAILRTEEISQLLRNSVRQGHKEQAIIDITKCVTLADSLRHKCSHAVKSLKYRPNNEHG